MVNEYTEELTSGGLSKHNRVLLDKLNREARAPFRIEQATKIINLSPSKTRRLLALWATKGWLTRIKRGLYSTVPLGAKYPQERKEDTWLVAEAAFGPCYVGGWSACEYWGMTEQIFKDIVVFTQKTPKKKINTIQGISYILKKVSLDRFFGLKPVWKGQVKIFVSDPSKTLVDMLHDPSIGGGIRNVALVIKEYFFSKKRDDKKLIDYSIDFGNRTVFKRLGYLLESLRIDAPLVIKACKSNISLGYSKLDPSIMQKGKIIKRWNLWINAALTGVA